MRYFSFPAALWLSACFSWAAAPPGAVLEYTLKVRRRQETTWAESRFRMIATPALVTGNKVKKPRLGRWRLEGRPAIPGGHGVAPSAALLAQAASLMYFAGPAPCMVMRDSGMKLGARVCRLWQVQTPAGLPVYAYLAEVAPDLLALSYLSASLGDGDPAALEIHLDEAHLGPRTSPAEEGTTLLRTLGRWGRAAQAPLAQPGETLASERID